MTDNANEAAKMKPRLASSGFRGGGLLGPFFFLGDGFADDAGLG